MNIKLYKNVFIIDGFCTNKKYKHKLYFMFNVYLLLVLNPSIIITVLYHNQTLTGSPIEPSIKCHFLLFC